MALSYPLSFPSSRAPSRITFHSRSAVGLQSSPITLEQTVFAWTGDLWLADVEYPPMIASEAEDIVAGLLLALNGAEGSFLMGPANAGYAGARGTWSAPLLSGAHAAGVKTLNLIGVDGKTWKNGDWLQLGSGSTSRLHKVVADGVQAGSPSLAQVEIWPRTRAAYSDGAAVTLSAPKGVWRLAGNSTDFSIEIGGFYAVRFSAIEARDS